MQKLRNSYSDIYPTNCNVTQFIYLETALHVSGGITTHHQKRKQLYLQHLVFVTPLLLPAAIAAGNSNGGKAITIIYRESVSALLVIQHLTRMRRIILSSVACLSLNIFPHFLINGTIIGKKLPNIKCVF